MWDCHDLDSNGFVVIAYLAMDCDIMLHTRNAMWIHWFICWTCKCCGLIANIAIDGLLILVLACCGAPLVVPQKGKVSI